VPRPRGKTTITIRLDDDVLEWFKAQVHRAGGGSYQTAINEALHRVIESSEQGLGENPSACASGGIAGVRGKPKTRLTGYRARFCRRGARHRPRGSLTTSTLRRPPSAAA